MNDSIDGPPHTFYPTRGAGLTKENATYWQELLHELNNYGIPIPLRLMAASSGIANYSDELEGIHAKASLKIYVRRNELFPTRNNRTDSGLDLRADLKGGHDGPELEVYTSNPPKCLLQPGEHVLMPTGVYAAVPAGYEIQVRSRSGLANNHGIIVINQPGTVDSSYRGEIKVGLLNTRKTSYMITDGDRIAQMVVCPISLVDPQMVKSVEELGTTKRGARGFGSSGVM